MSAKPYKWLALGAVGLYVWKLFESKGTSVFSGDELHLDDSTRIKINPEKLVDVGLSFTDLPIEKRELLRMGAAGFFGKMRKNRGE